MHSEEKKDDTMNPNTPPPKPNLDPLSAALSKYEAATGLAYTTLPPELCEGIHLHLNKWSLVVTDESLKTMATVTRDRVTKELKKPKERKKYKKQTVEEELAELSQLSEMTEEIVVDQKVSKRKTRLELSMASALGEDAGPSAEEQNAEEEALIAANAANHKIRWSNAMKKHGLLTLDIAGADRVTDLGLKSVADTCSSLRNLDITGAYRITDVGIRALALCAGDLRSLNLSGCMGVVGPGFAVVGQCCSQLTTLKLSGCKQIPTWVMLNIFEGCRQIEEMDLSYCVKLSDHEVKTMAAKCKVIKTLNLSECKQVSDVGVLAVSQGCMALEELDLSRSELQFKITDVSLLALGERSDVLRKINLKGCDMVTDAGLAWLAAGCKGLEWLDITNCSKVTNGGMRCLGEGCPDLTYCNLSHLKKVTDVGLRFLAQGCDKLHTLNATGVFLLSDGMKRDFGFEGIQALGRAPCATTIKTLNLTGCFQISTVACKSLAMLVNVENLCMSGCVNLTTQGMGYLADSMANVKMLSFAYCGDCVTDSMMARCARRWPKLSSVVLTECEKVGIGACKALSKCRNLQRIDLTGCLSVDDMSLNELSEARYWPGVTALYLTGCRNVGDTGLTWVCEGMRSTINTITLITLSIKGTKCSTSALKSMKDQFPYSDMRKNDSFFGLWPHSRATDRMQINDYGLLYRSATKVQALWQARKGRRLGMEMKTKHCKTKAAKFLQAHWRGRVARERARFMMSVKHLRRDMAIRIQNMYKAWGARRWLRAKRQHAWLERANWRATQIQRVYRGVKGRARFEVMAKQARYLKELKSRAVVYIQVLARMYLAKCEVSRRKKKKEEWEKLCWAKSWKVQCCWRQKAARIKVQKRRKWLRDNNNLVRSSASMIQNKYRSHRCKTVLREKITERRAKTYAATYVQACWRARCAWLEVETRRQIWAAEQESMAALIMQRAWRRKAAQKLIEAMKEEQKRVQRVKESMASLLERWWRGVIARREYAKVKANYLAQLRRMADLENWGSTIIAAAWRGKGGRDLGRARLWERKARWKEMWSEEESRKFYYNQISGEIRYRKPQDLLDLMKRPICGNCEFYEARLECAACGEFFCSQCWDSVHFGGKRAKHGFRQLYDFYEKRVDYGDGEFPGRWPSEIEQDEFAGWRLRVYPARKPYKVVGDWEIYMDGEDDDSGRFFYHNRMKHLSQYNKPEELKTVFRDDWDGEDEGGDKMIEQFNREKDEEKKNDHDGVKDCYFKPEEDEEPAEDLWQGWGKYWDEEGGEFYYFNVNSGVSQYERPSEDFETRNDPFLGIREAGEMEDVE